MIGKCSSPLSRTQVLRRLERADTSQYVFNPLMDTVSVCIENSETFDFY